MWITYAGYFIAHFADSGFGIFIGYSLAGLKRAINTAKPTTIFGAVKYFTICSFDKPLAIAKIGERQCLFLVSFACTLADCFDFFFVQRWRTM